MGQMSVIKINSFIKTVWLWQHEEGCWCVYGSSYIYNNKCYLSLLVFIYIDIYNIHLVTFCIYSFIPYASITDLTTATIIHSSTDSYSSYIIIFCLLLLLYFGVLCAYKHTQYYVPIWNDDDGVVYICNTDTPLEIKNVKITPSKGVRNNI